MIRIVADSCLDTNEELRKKIDPDLVPFKLQLDQKVYLDDDDLDLDKFVREMKASQKPGSACPSPDDFLKEYEKEGDIFAITITSKLSGTYNSAKLAKDLYYDRHGDDKFIHVFDTKSASSGELLTALKIKELLEQKLSYDEVVERVNAYIDQMKLFFISESLDNLIKNGRMSKVKGMIANALNIIPIMCAIEGEIDLYDKVRGKKKALKRMVDIIGSTASDFSDRIIAIAHADNIEVAEKLSSEIETRFNFKKVLVVPMRGLSTLYADHKGIIIAY